MCMQAKPLCLQMTKQLENEKERLIDKKRNEQEERQRKQLELERILEDNRRLVITSIPAVLSQLQNLVLQTHDKLQQMQYASI